MKTTKTTMYVYPLRGKVIPFRLDKALVDVSYDKWNESIMIEDYGEKGFSVFDVEQLRERLKSLIPNVHRFGGQSKLQHDIIDDEFNNFKGNNIKHQDNCSCHDCKELKFRGSD